MMSYCNFGGPAGGQAWAAWPPDILHFASRDGFPETRRRNSNTLHRSGLFAKTETKSTIRALQVFNVGFPGIQSLEFKIAPSEFASRCVDSDGVHEMSQVIY